jgi:hypothetical protein
MEKWYLITHANKQFEGREQIFFSNRENLPPYTSCSPGFNTEKELKDHCRLPNWKCSKCGGEVSLTYHTNSILEENKMCFSCNHFREQFEKMKTNKNKFIINGGFYTVYPENSNSYFKGFGGRLFIIKNLKTGEIIHTKNLWHQGEIPKIWAAENTAEFVDKI